MMFAAEDFSKKLYINKKQKVKKRKKLDHVKSGLTKGKKGSVAEETGTNMRLFTDRSAQCRAMLNRDRDILQCMAGNF